MEAHVLEYARRRYSQAARSHQLASSRNSDAPRANQVVSGTQSLRQATLGSRHARSRSPPTARSRNYAGSNRSGSSRSTRDPDPPWKVDRSQDRNLTRSTPASASTPPWQRNREALATKFRAEAHRPPAQRRGDSQTPYEVFGYKDPRGVGWSRSGNGMRMIFIDGDAVSSELLSCAKSVCGSLAYWDKDLERSCCEELQATSDGGWPADFVVEGHCDRIVLPHEAGALSGLAAAAMGSNKKKRTQALALGILLAAAEETAIAQDLRGHSPEMRALSEVSRETYDALDKDGPVEIVESEEELPKEEDYDYDSEDDFRR